MRKDSREKGYGTTSVSRWIRLNLYSFRISLLLLISSKAISMASGMPAPHQALLPVIGAIEPMYKGLPCVVEAWITPCAVRHVNVTIHLDETNSILQREYYSATGQVKLSTSILFSFFFNFYRFFFDVRRLFYLVRHFRCVQNVVPKENWVSETWTSQICLMCAALGLYVSIVRIVSRK